jgi:Family of unknown function (DUF5995)
VSVDTLLAGRLPCRMRDVIELMQELEAALPREDGVRAFLRLYRAVTEAVDGAVGAGSAYRDLQFVRWLDVVFANRFFRALRDDAGRSKSVPRAWAPLFAVRARPGIAPIQFALAGMNAHINRDLPLALVETWSALGLEPRRDGPQYADFVRLNAVLEDAEERVKGEYATGALGHLDRSLGQLDDVVAMWNVARAREAAWVNGETLWALRGDPQLRGEYELMLDRLVGFAGRGLLRPLS